MCRCLETGQLMAVGPVETSWALLPDTGPSHVRLLELKELVSSWRGPGTLVLVTHAQTVNPLTGFMPQQAETVVLKPTPGSERGELLSAGSPHPDSGAARNQGDVDATGVKPWRASVAGPAGDRM